MRTTITRHGVAGSTRTTFKGLGTQLGLGLPTSAVACATSYKRRRRAQQPSHSLYNFSALTLRSSNTQTFKHSSYGIGRLRAVFSAALNGTG